MTPPIIRSVAKVAEGIGHVIAGRHIDAARAFADATLEIVPVTVAHQELDDAAIRRANAIADIAQAAKFGEGGTQ